MAEVEPVFVPPDDLIWEREMCPVMIAGSAVAHESGARIPQTRLAVARPDFWAGTIPGAGGGFMGRSSGNWGDFVEDRLLTTNVGDFGLTMTTDVVM